MASQRLEVASGRRTLSVVRHRVGVLLHLALVLRRPPLPWNRTFSSAGRTRRGIGQNIQISKRKLHHDSAIEYIVV
ncbi:hypothetical protein AAHA92_31203 [Salvia divinorum]|uniref:Uncharacterized protein n=1 Tax=Salvia divinorum TaxID=28513 RepID=A0ABD1FTX6_SALDI